MTAAKKTTATEIPNIGPTVLRIPSWVNTIEKVIATVAAEAAITLPMDVNAFLTA